MAANNVPPPTVGAPPGAVVAQAPLNPQLTALAVVLSSPWGMRALGTAPTSHEFLLKLLQLVNHYGVPRPRATPTVGTPMWAVAAHAAPQNPQRTALAVVLSSPWGMRL